MKQEKIELVNNYERKLEMQGLDSNNETQLIRKRLDKATNKLQEFKTDIMKEIRLKETIIERYAQEINIVEDMFNIRMY